MDIRARIFRPAPSAMQSGRANSKQWLLEYEPAGPRRRDPLMGWSGSADTASQVRLSFASREDAVAYAERRGLAYELHEPHRRDVRPKSYAANFRWKHAR